MPLERTVLVTGISGNLGGRLLPLLSDFRVVGVDARPPNSSALHRFEEVDLGREKILLAGSSNYCAKPVHARSCISLSS